MSTQQYPARLHISLGMAELRRLHKKLRSIRRTQPEATQQDAIRALIVEETVTIKRPSHRAGKKG